MTALDKAGLVALAERVEALAGRCEKTAQEVRCAVFAGPECWVEQSRFNGKWCIYRKDSRGNDTTWQLWNLTDLQRNGDFTASLDAAMTLAEGAIQMDVLRDAIVKLSLDGWITGRYAETLARYVTAAALRSIAAGQP